MPIHTLSLQCRAAGLVLALVLSTPAAAAPPEAERDARLDTKLTLDLTHVTVDDLCWVIEKRTGVVVTPADTETGDLLARAHGEMSARDLLGGLAEALALDWSADRNFDPLTYRLARTAASLRRLQYVERLEREQLIPRLRQAIRNPPPVTEDLSDLTPEEAADRVREEMSERQLAAAVLATLSGDQLRAVCAGEELVIPIDALPTAVRSSVLRQASADRPGWADAFPGPALNDIAGVPGSAPPSLWILRQVSQVDFGCIQFLVATRSLAGLWRLPVVLTAYGVPPAAAPRLPSASGLMGFVPRPAARPFDLDRLIAVVRRLGDDLQMAIVSDAYGVDWDGHLPVYEAFPDAPEAASFLEVLDQFGREEKQRWGRIGEVWTFQHMDWAERRRLHVPETLVRRATRELLMDDKVSEETAMGLLALPSTQLDTTAGGFRDVVDVLRRSRQPLELWWRLPGKAREAAERDGIRLADLPLRDQRAAMALAADVLHTNGPLALAQTRLRVEPTAGGWEFEFAPPGMNARAVEVSMSARAEITSFLRAEWERRRAALMEAAGVTDEKDLPPSLRN